MINYIKLFKDYRVPYTTSVNRGWVQRQLPLL